MKILRDGNRSVTVRIEGALDLRQVIALPKLIARLPADLGITLDFSRAAWARESALTVLIPALASIHRPTVKVVGLGDEFAFTTDAHEELRAAA